METKKYISPGGWFSLDYPSQWNEFEDTEDSFLFYNPEKWNGNFRISAFKDASSDYAETCINDELKSNHASRMVKVGNWKCAYSCENFTENGEHYDSHFWITGEGSLSVECSFTVQMGGKISMAEEVLASLIIRPDAVKLPMEIIPIRVLEINQVNEAYDWAVSAIKKKLKKDFTSSKQDIDSIQKMIDEENPKPEQRKELASYGIAFGTILVNEMDGMDWVTVIDGKKEYPALRFGQTSVMVYPTDLIHDKKQKNEHCSLIHEFDCIRKEVEEVL